MKLQHLVEEKVGFLIVFTVLVISVGLLIEAVPLFFTKAVTQPAPGVKPYNAVQVAGRDIYVREGCYNCHSQMIRPFRAETERYGHYSVAGESVYDRPFQWGSKRTGPDWPVSADVIPMSGTVSICSTRAMSSPNPICLHSRGWPVIKWMRKPLSDT